MEIKKGKGSLKGEASDCFEIATFVEDFVHSGRLIVVYGS